MKKHFFAIGLLLFAVFFFSCEKEEQDIDPLKDTDTEKAANIFVEYALVQKLFSDASDESVNAAIKTEDMMLENGTEKNSQYPLITIEPSLDTLDWPKTITVNYGEENYLCNDERYRRGKIIFEMTNRYIYEGTELTVSFDNYYQDDNKVEGTKLIKNEGRNENNNLVYSVVINDGIVITPDEKEIYFEQNTTREWIEGEDTPLNICDDVYLINGTQTGVSSDDVSYSIIITESLNVQVCCKWIRGGELDLDIQDFPTITVNFGIDECNPDAVITILNQDISVEME